MIRRGSVVGTYWWTGLPNFGDDLTPMLLPRYGIVPVHRRAVEARLAGVGSILEHLPPGFTGAVWGSGLMDDAARPMPEAKFLAVRGRLTAERVDAPDDTALGDPGLLVSRGAAALNRSGMSESCCTSVSAEIARSRASRTRPGRGYA